MARPDRRTAAHRGPPAVSDPAQQYLRTLSIRAARRIPQLTRDVTAQIQTQMQVYDVRAAVSADELLESVSTNLTALVDALGHATSADVTRARATGTARARQGVPLTEVLHAFRIGFSGLWDVLLELAGSAGDIEQRTLIAAANTFWYLTSDVLDAVTEGFRETTAELVRDQRQRRGALLEALLSGNVTTNHAMWEAGELLGLPHDGTFAVVAAETVELARPALAGIEALLTGHGVASAWRLTPSYEFGVVSLGSPDRLPDLIRLLGERARGRVGVSPAYSGLGETPRALHLAHVARSSLPTGEPSAACFDASPLSMLVAASPDESVDVAHQVLGPLLALPVPDRDLLLETAEMWIAQGGSIKLTAAELFCHPNTVRYRLQRLQTEMQMLISDPTAIAELVVALRAWRMFAAARHSTAER